MCRHTNKQKLKSLTASEGIAQNGFYHERLVQVGHALVRRASPSAGGADAVNGLSDGHERVR